MDAGIRSADAGSRIRSAERTLDLELGHSRTATTMHDGRRWIMAAKVSAGLVMSRRNSGGVQFLLMHPGGPLHTRRDAGAWTIPKGEVEPDEDLLAAARREFEEETGFRPEGPF